MRSLDLPAESALQVNEETTVTVRMAKGSPELLIYTPFSFGGDDAEAWPAEAVAGSGGRVGNGFSLGIYDDENSARGPGFCYVFGAGQGPISEIAIDDPAARWQIVNDEIDGWVIVMSEDAELGELDWQLIGPGGDVVHSGRGFPGQAYRCAVR